MLTRPDLRRPRALAVLSAVVATLALALAGCGGSSDANTSTGGGASSGSGSSSSSSAAAGGTTTQLALVGYSTPKKAYDALTTAFQGRPWIPQTG